MRRTARECVVEARPKHDDELRHMGLAASCKRNGSRLRHTTARPDATDASNTYSNIWIVLRHRLMGRRGFPFPRGRRRRAMLEESQDGAVLLPLFLRGGLCGRRLRDLYVHLIIGGRRRRQGRVRVGHGWRVLWLMLFGDGGGSCGCGCGMGRGTANRTRLGTHEVMLVR
jgi:hypothetical protein